MAVTSPSTRSETGRVSPALAGVCGDCPLVVLPETSTAATTANTAELFLIIILQEIYYSLTKVLIYHPPMPRNPQGIPALSSDAHFVPPRAMRLKRVNDERVSVLTVLVDSLTRPLLRLILAELVYLRDQNLLDHQCYLFNRRLAEDVP